MARLSYGRSSRGDGAAVGAAVGVDVGWAEANILHSHKLRLTDYDCSFLHSIYLRCRLQSILLPLVVQYQIGYERLERCRRVWWRSLCVRPRPFRFFSVLARGQGGDVVGLEAAALSIRTVAGLANTCVSQGPTGAHIPLMHWMAQWRCSPITSGDGGILDIDTAFRERRVLECFGI